MRLRNVIAASVGAGMLILASPAAASAAEGGFTYRYVNEFGQVQHGSLTDPPSGVCITLPEVADPYSSEPADSPRNRTDATAVVFTEPDCEGDYFSLRPKTGHGSDRLKLRSVVFS